MDLSCHDPTDAPTACQGGSDPYRADQTRPSRLRSLCTQPLNPYRDLIVWWHRFTQFHVGRASEERAMVLASTRTDEKTDAWLYELWIALAFIHLLQEHGVLPPQDMSIATDLLQFTFTWQKRRFRFLYNRQLDTSTTYEPDWEHGPSSRPDYTIEREMPLEVRHQESLVWREPPIVLDAKYYLEGKDPSNTHGPIKKLLGDMTLLGAQVGALFFPRLLNLQENVTSRGPSAELGNAILRSLRHHPFIVLQRQHGMP